MPEVLIPLGPSTDDFRGPAWLASGHRPFFLLSGLWGASSLVLWLLALRGIVPLASAWHGHEMLYGFAVAAIAGFLQAAVPKWTGRPVYRGWRVALLVALWLAGRLGMLVPGLAALDLVFLPVLAAFIGWDVWRARNRRNAFVPLMLVALWGLDVVYHLRDPSLALRLAVFLVASLIALIGGRIVPSFTQNALRQAGEPAWECTTPRWLDVLAVPAVLWVAATELFWPLSTASGVVAVAAGLVLGARMWAWRTWQTRRLPIVWILHVGMAFVAAGFLLKGLADLGGPVSTSAALHALTAGGIGVMILAVMSRASLGHSGRPLVVSRVTVAAYVLVTVGALLRVTLPHPHALLTAGALWSMGYALFVWVYAPILTRPRVDGQPG